jgi:hypothetical protein
MTDLKTLEKVDLYALLARYTSEYTRLFTNNGDPVELERLHHLMLSIQEELASRKQTETQL